jgi:hypothetical protein
MSRALVSCVCLVPRTSKIISQIFIKAFLVSLIITLDESFTTDIPQIFLEENDILIADFTEKVVYEAIMQMKKNKATSGKQAFGQASLVPAVIWAGTKGLATSPDIRRSTARQPLVPVR